MRPVAKKARCSNLGGRGACGAINQDPVHGTRRIRDGRASVPHATRRLADRLSAASPHETLNRYPQTYGGGVPFGVVSDEEIFARIENLFDRHYSEAFSFPAPPINFVAGVKAYFF